MLSDYVSTCNQYNRYMAELEMQLTEVRKRYEFKLGQNKTKIEEIKLSLKKIAEEN